MPQTNEQCSCGGYFFFNNHCGCYVCENCDSHKGLARCYCGWSLSGNDGRRELTDMGETIEPIE